MPNCTYPFSSLPSSSRSPASVAFPTASAFERSILKRWIVAWSLETEIKVLCLLNYRSRISALSAPRLNIHTAFPLVVFHTLTKVPFSEAVAKSSPFLLRAIAAIDPWCVSQVVSPYLSWLKFLTLTWPFSVWGIARTATFVSGLRAQRPYGLLHVSRQSISVRSAKL